VEAFTGTKKVKEVQMVCGGGKVFVSNEFFVYVIDFRVI
jgi:hypothetical protein